MLFPVALLSLSLVGWLVPVPDENEPTTPDPATAAASSDRNKTQKKRLEEEFLVFGTVFTEQGFALPGAAIRVRRAGERKVRWQARSDRRGEFGVRLPMGAEYEMTVTAEGYQDQARKVDARAGTRVDFVFRLSPAPGGKQK